tara:strand:- start:105 stop:293 length:189 start_codon:yes stop_codon:yes gene_type:complete
MAMYAYCCDRSHYCNPAARRFRSDIGIDTFRGIVGVVFLPKVGRNPNQRKNLTIMLLSHKIV